jgi:putative ABC transport system permease protein
VDPGFRATNLLTMRVTMPLSRYPTPERALVFYQAAQREISAVPGVQSVALGGSLPLDGWDIGQGFELVGGSSTGESLRDSAHYQIVGAGYFDTLGIPILSGRPFTEQDTASTTPVCIVNQEFVRKYVSGRDPIGMHVTVQAMDPRGPMPVTREIVGVSHQVKVEGLGQTDSSVEIYVPITQNPWYSASISIRASGDPLALAQAIKAAITRVDKDQPVTQIRTMQQIAEGTIAQPKCRAQLVGVFAAVAIALACIGIFGVLAFSVSQRTREFGIRMALGARGGDVLKLVLGGGVKITAAGILLGLAAAAGLTRSLESRLFGVKPLDPITFLAAPVALATVALAACAMPALRAARVDPASVLRQE